MPDGRNQAAGASFLHHHEYGMAAVMSLQEINALLSEEERPGERFILKAVALALRQFPNLNAVIRG
jgi:pyruvate/2-oxoglutarate dehydrogenase complex dihydrolipoamide acyltransferase (E2) component